MEESGLVRCDSLDTASLSERDMMSPVEALTYSSEGPDPSLGPEPTPAELAQCEAEVGTLLSIIAELNKKMGSLKAPSDPGNMRSPAASRPLVPDLLSHRLVRNPERKAAETALPKPTLLDRGGGGVVWSRLQDVLSSVEDSISFRRSWAAPITAVDLNKHKEHLRAAHESSVRAGQILDEMERDFGISCANVQPKGHFNEEAPEVDRRDFTLSALQSPQEELERAHSLSLMEEDRDKLVNFHKAWRSGRCSPSYRPSAMSSAGSASPDWASPPYPGSPLLQRRTSRGLAPLSAAGEVSPLGSGICDSPCTSPTGPEAETERLNRLIDRLKARNERLSAALERRKTDLEHMSLTVNRLETDGSALQLALRYCEECEEAYRELLSLYEAKTHQTIPRRTDAAGEAGGTPSDLTDTEELSTSFSTAGVSEEVHIQRTPEEDREVSLRQLIESLKKERAAICLPKAGPGGAECKLIPDSGSASGSRAGHMNRDRPPDTKKEKTSLFYELISVREEMSDLRALIRLKEKELRCIEWSLMAQKAQDAAGAFIPEREEQEERRAEQQRLCDLAAKMGNEGDLSRPILKELQAVLQREQVLKKRLALVQDSMNTALSDNGPQRRDNGEQIARLTQAHSKALSSYRHIRRKYREQVWRLEQKVAAMMESQQQHSGASGPSKTAAAASAEDNSDWRREETVL
uniref:Usher syndrome 1C binding protein 1 n=1 Tax=Neogobius melanostomus TaxID=47308 RepID=A0A8C6V7V6_9GOBI